MFQYPVYFGFEDEHVNAMLADIKKNDATGQPATATTGGLVYLSKAITLESINIWQDSKFSSSLAYYGY